MDDKYGIELDLIMKSFNKKIKTIKKSIKEIENIKVNIELNSKTINANKLIDKTRKEIKEIQEVTNEFNPNDISGMLINGKPWEDYITKIKGARTELGKFTKVNKIETPKIKTSEAPQIDTNNIENTTKKLEESTQKIEPISNKFSKIIDKIKQKIKCLKTETIEIDVEDAEIDLLRYKISELEERLQNASKLHLSTKEIVETRAKLAKLNKEYDKLIKNEEESGSKGNSTFNSLGNGIGKVVSKIKRFTLSLLSIRTVYSLLSKASSAYLSQDTSLANKLQAVWVGLGAMLEPIISRIVNVMLKAVKYINVFIKALTGVDLLAKATQKSLGGTTKSAKALSKALAVFDELTNLDTTSDTSSSGLDTSWADSFNNIELNSNVTQIIEDLATKINKLKQVWDELDPSIQKIIKGLGIAGILGILTGKPGLILGVETLILGIDGLCKIFDGDLTKSVEGLIELLGVAGLIGILTGKAGLTVAIGGVVLALFGLNEMINGDTGEAIEGLTLLIGGSGLAGAFLGGTKGLSLGIAISSVITILRGFNDLLDGDSTKSVKGFIELVAGTTGLVVAINLIRGGTKAGLLGLITPLSLATIGFVALAAGVGAVIKNWNNMNTLEKVVSVLGLIAIGAAAAAAAVGALQSAWSLGIAAAAIVAGTVAIAAAVSSANKRAQENLPQLAVGTNYVPEDQLAMIHKGEAVIPKKFNSQEYFGGNNQETNSLLQTLIEKVEGIEINPYTTVKDVGQATVSYVKSKERQTGKKVFA